MPPATQGKGHVSTALLSFSAPIWCDHGVHFCGHLAPSRGPMWHLHLGHKCGLRGQSFRAQVAPVSLLGFLTTETFFFCKAW